MPKPIFALPKNNAALVKGLRRLPFTEESRVRIPYVVQSLQKILKVFWFKITFQPNLPYINTGQTQHLPKQRFNGRKTSPPPFVFLLTLLTAVKIIRSCWGKSTAEIQCASSFYVVKFAENEPRKASQTRFDEDFSNFFSTILKFLFS